MIKVYGLEDEMEVEKIKMYLRHRKADFTFIEMEENDEAKTYLLHKLNHASTPIVEFDKKFVCGFDTKGLDTFINMSLEVAV